MTRRVGGEDRCSPNDSESFALKLARARERCDDQRMASRKRTPETSRITRPAVVAFARKQKPSGEPDGDGDDEPADAPAAAASAAPADVTPPAAGEAKAESPGGTGAPLAGDGAKSARSNELPTPVDIPQAASADAVEAPTQMPGPRDIPSGNPEDPAAPPGRVPPGDSRSLRRGGEFALVYRAGTFVITRSGTVGTRGQWRVVEYPTSAAASHAYAKECSRFVADGFSDYRD